jgi:hypothetical protein
MMIFDELKIGEQFRPWDEPYNKVYTKQRGARRHNSLYQFIIDGRVIWAASVPRWKPVIRHESKTEEG